MARLPLHSMSATETFRQTAVITGWACAGPAKRLKGTAMTTGLLLLINVVLYGGGVRPVVQAVTVRQEESQATRQELQQLFLYQRAKQELDALYQQLPARRDLAETIGRVSSMGRRVGVSIPEMNFQPEQTASEQWAKINLQFNASGRYANIRKFLAAIEGSDEPFVIESISLQKEGRRGRVVARLTVGIYAREG